MSTKICCKPYFSARPTLAFRSFFTRRIITLHITRCTMRGRTNAPAFERQPESMLASSSVTHLPNITKKTHLLTIRWTRAVSFISSSLGSLQSPSSRWGNAAIRDLYVSEPASKSCLCSAARTESHCVPGPAGKKISKFVGYMSGQQALVPPKAGERGCMVLRIWSQSSYYQHQTPSPCHHQRPLPKARHSHKNKANRLLPLAMSAAMK
mmetsp:Transcript_127557/g.366965  ORF Transcript_127557/g.366965 Transcript_127557/m.366965 type:complete len:209 (-) Transcript_127557:468-1094(-)